MDACSRLIQQSAIRTTYTFPCTLLKEAQLSLLALCTPCRRLGRPRWLPFHQIRHKSSQVTSPQFLCLPPSGRTGQYICMLGLEWAPTEHGTPTCTAVSWQIMSKVQVHRTTIPDQVGQPGHRTQPHQYNITMCGDFNHLDAGKMYCGSQQCS
jgi:hypothetical protein